MNKTITALALLALLVIVSEVKAVEEKNTGNGTPPSNVGTRSNRR